MRGVVEGYEYLQTHRHEFTGQVYGPIMAELQVIYPKYAQALEQQCGHVLRWFVCQRRWA